LRGRTAGAIHIELSGRGGNVGSPPGSRAKATQPPEWYAHTKLVQHRRFRWERKAFGSRAACRSSVKNSFSPYSAVLRASVLPRATYNL